MALDTYEDVKAAITRWLVRPDMAGEVDDFITMFEARINRVLGAPGMEFMATLELTPGDNEFPLPPGYRGMRALAITSSTPKRGLTYRTPQTLDKLFTVGTQAVPLYFTTQGNRLRLEPIPDAAYTIQMTYIKGIIPLREATTAEERWLLSDHPDIYVYGPLKEANVRLQRYEINPLFEAEYKGRVADLQEEARRARASAGPLESVVEFYTP